MKNEPASATPEMLTVTQAAEYLQVHRETIKRHLAAGRLPGLRIGRFWRIRKSELDALSRKPPGVEGSAAEGNRRTG